MLRGEEGGRGRSGKWDPDTVTASITDVEKEILEQWLYDEFVRSGVEFSDREVTEYHYPADAIPGLPFIEYGIRTKGDVASAFSHQELIANGKEQVARLDAPLYEFAKCEPIKRTKEVRTIMCYPFHVHCYLLSKLLAFSEAVKSLPECAIGWSKWYLGVHDLCTEMSKHREVCEMDARRFDSTLPTCLVRLALEVYFSLWPDCDPDEVENIINTIVSGCVFSSNGEVYYKVGGNPSGNPVTTELNTVVHLLLLLLAWYRKHGDLKKFRDCTWKLYGDDIKYGHDGQITPWEISELLSDMPVKYPAENIKVSGSSEGLTFLGCTFYRPPESLFWLWRPAKPAKLLSTLKYQEKGDGENDLALELARVRGLLLECAWDKALWNILYPYQLLLEEEGASEPVVGKRVTRQFVTNLTFGLQGGVMPNKRKNNKQLTAVQKARRSAKRNEKRKIRRRLASAVHAVPQRVVGSGVAPRGYDLKRAIANRVVPGNVRLGTTANGVRAAIKALDPAAEIGAAQWPDRNTADTCTMQNLDVVDIPPPTGITAGQAWDCNIFLTPFPDCPALIVRWVSGTSPPSVNKLNSADVKVTGQDDMWSTTHQMIYSPPWAALGNYPADYFQQIRLTARSATVELVAAGLYDQGTVYGGQFGADIKAVPLPASAIKDAIMADVRVYLQKNYQNKSGGESPMDTDEVDKYTPDETGFYTVYQAFPETFQELAQLDKKYYQCDAKEGIYMPLKHSAATTMTLEECSQQYHLCPLKPTASPNERWGHHVMYGQSWQVGVIMFRNLLSQAQLNLKLVSCVEATPIATSITAKFSEEAPKLDQEAIDNTQEVMCRLSSAHPASANVLGTLIDKIGSVLSGGGGILGTIGKLTQSPMGKKVTGWLDSVV